MNAAPVYPLTPKIAAVQVTAANTNSDGTGTIATDIFLVATVSASGAKLDRIEWWPTATTAGTATTATVGRAFLCDNSSGSTTGANTHPLGEVALASQSADSATVPVIPIVLVINKAIPASKSILVTNHAAPAANSKWKAVAIYGDYV